jgi:hypothetical protein
MNSQTRCTAFEGSRRIASGELRDVALKAKEVLDRGEYAPVLIFDEETAEPVDLDFRGTPADVVSRLQETAAAPAEADPEAPRRARRANLGEEAPEVNLQPRHWDWLNGQPGGASVALRKLVEHARRANEGIDRIRRAREAAYRFMSAMAGNEPGFEEAARALFAGNRERFDQQVALWPGDVRDHAKRLAAAGFEAVNAASAVSPAGGAA